MSVRQFRLLKTVNNLNLSNCSWYSTQTDINSIFLGLNKKNPIRVRGWVKALRKMKDSVFIDINDGSNPKHLQLMIHKSLIPKDLTFGASVETTGNVSVNSNNNIELLCEDLKIVGPCVSENGYPFAPKKSYSDDYLRQYPHLRCRTSRFSSLLRIRHCFRSAINEFFSNRDFIHIDTPIMTSNDCEGAGEVFKVVPENSSLTQPKNSNEDSSYFDTKAYLTVSGQLHLEAMARSLSRVYCFGPTFRAENSKSRLHLSEFYMVEAESSYVTDSVEISSFVELLVKESFRTVLDNCIEDIVSYNKFNQEQRKISDEIISKITSKPFTTISYNEAADICEKNHTLLNSQFVRGNSLSKDHELFLIKYNNNIPLFITDWPKNIKPFYMKCKNDETVLALDLICPIVGEVCGGSVREDNYDVLKNKIEQLNIVDKLNWYLELRKYGNVPTGGFGLGFERLIQVLLATTNIKDTIPFPRWPHNCQL